MSSTINTSSINDILADVVETNTEYGILDADIEAIGNYNLEDDYHLSLDTTYDHTLKNHNNFLKAIIDDLVNDSGKSLTDDEKKDIIEVAADGATSIQSVVDNIIKIFNDYDGADAADEAADDAGAAESPSPTTGVVLDGTKKAQEVFDDLAGQNGVTITASQLKNALKKVLGNDMHDDINVAIDVVAKRVNSDNLLNFDEFEEIIAYAEQKSGKELISDVEAASEHEVALIDGSGDARSLTEVNNDLKLYQLDKRPVYTLSSGSGTELGEKEKLIDLVAEAMEACIDTSSGEAKFNEDSFKGTLGILNYNNSVPNSQLHEILAEAALKFAQSDKAKTLATYDVERNGGDAPMGKEDNALVTVMHAFTFEETTDRGTNQKNTEVLRNIANNIGYLVNSKGLKDKPFTYDALGDAIHKDEDYGNYTNNDGTRVEIRHGWEDGWNGNKHEMEKINTDSRLDAGQKWLEAGSEEQKALLETKEKLVAMDLTRDDYASIAYKAENAHKRAELENLLVEAMKQCIGSDGVFCEESFQDVLEAAGYDRYNIHGSYFNQCAAVAIRRFAVDAEGYDPSLVPCTIPGQEGRTMSKRDGALVTIMHAFTFDQKNNGGVLGDLINEVGKEIRSVNINGDKLFTSDALGDAIHMDHAYAGDSGAHGNNKDTYRVNLRHIWEGHMPAD